MLFSSKKFLFPLALSLSLGLGGFLTSATAGRQDIVAIENVHDDDGKLFPYKEIVNGEERFGYRTVYGQVVIKPQFYSARDFEGGYAEVRIVNKKDNEFSYSHQYNVFDGEILAIIDRTGKIVVRGKSGELFSCYSDGLLVKDVLPRSAKPGLHKYTETSLQVIDIKTGKIFPLPPKTSSFGCFKDGIALVGIGRIPVGSSFRAAKLGYIGKNGKFKIQPTFDYAENFSAGLALVTKGQRQFFIDTQGKKIAVNNVELMAGETFREGLAVSSGDGSDSTPVKIIGINGKVVASLPANLKHAKNWNDQGFVNGLLRVQDKKTLMYGYVDKKGELVIATQFKEAKPFRKGFADVVMAQGQEAYIDTNGKILWAKGQPSPQ
jgi:hypothetical protein